MYIPSSAFSSTVNNAGSLPDSWGGAGAFPSLSNLALLDLEVAGPLPGAWAGNGSFPALELLSLGSPTGASGLLGTLPASWGSPGAFQQMQQLSIVNSNITGMQRVGKLFGSQSASQ